MPGLTYLTREVAEPICSGSSEMELKDTSNDFIAVSLRMREHLTIITKVNKMEANKKAQENTHSPMAAGSWESLLWLTFNTTKQARFLRSSLKTSISLCAKISFCKSTAYNVQDGGNLKHFKKCDERRRMHQWKRIWIDHLPPVFSFSGCFQTLIHLCRYLPAKLKSPLSNQRLCSSSYKMGWSSEHKSIQDLILSKTFWIIKSIYKQKKERKRFIIYWRCI